MKTKLHFLDAFTHGADVEPTMSDLVKAMEQHALKNVINCLNANIYSYLETSGGQSSNLFLDVVHFFNNSFY